MRIRVCRSGDQECFVKKHSICPCVLLFPSSAEFLRKYHIKCAPLHAEFTVVPFLSAMLREQGQGSSRRAPFTIWSEYKYISIN